MPDCNDIVGNEGHPAFREFRGIVSNMCGGLIGNAGYKLRRYIATLNGGDQSIQFATDLDVVAGDKLRIPFATAQTGVVRDLVGGAVQFDAADLLQITSCTATINGAAVADGASIAAYLDALTNEIELTFTAPITITRLGQSGSNTNFFAGSILDAYFTPVATGVEAHYPVSNGDLVSQGGLVFNNFTAIPATWELATRDNVNAWWAGANIAAAISDDAATTDINSTGDWATLNNAVLTSQSGVTSGGAYALEFDFNTAPTSGAACYTGLLPPLISGRRYRTEYYARHVGIGGNISVGVGPTAAGGGPEVLAVTDTTFTKYGQSFIASLSADNFSANEHSPTNDGGLYLDKLTLSRIWEDA